MPVVSEGERKTGKRGRGWLLLFFVAGSLALPLPAVVLPSWRPVELHWGDTRVRVRSWFVTPEDEAAARSSIDRAFPIFPPRMGLTHWEIEDPRIGEWSLRCGSWVYQVVHTPYSHR